MDLQQRASRYAALGDTTRLAIVDHLAVTDVSPAEIGRVHGLSSNLVAHHLRVLEEAGLIERVVSAGDRRRKYVRLRSESLAVAGSRGWMPGGPVLFVCTHNSARSQLAAALWTAQTGEAALSAGTQPAASVHPGAIAAAARAGLDLTGARPQDWNEVSAEDLFVITVCDQAHEELESRTDHWHWSTPDPVRHPTKRSFDTALRRLRRRITTLTGAT
jgi:protein-tyrosine-phosphatase/DNA-binding transcriptional ArsR family regulator